MSSSAVHKQETRLAQLPHQLFLFNTIGNHVLLTVITISIAMSSPLWTLLIPFISICIIGFTLVRGMSLKNHPSMLIRCHWQIVMRRTRIFLISYATLAVAASLGWLLFTYGGAMKELVFALVGGLGLMPVMVMVLALTVIESESLTHAAQNYVPDWALRKYGTDEEKRALEEDLAAAS